MRGTVSSLAKKERVVRGWGGYSYGEDLQDYIRKENLSANETSVFF